MEQKEKVITNVMKASDIFESVYHDFDSKVELLKNVYKNKNYAKECSNSSQIYEAIRILGDNAIEEIPRRYQQQFLAELVKVVMSKPTYDFLYKFFNENNVQFNAFCLMYIHFFDEAISEKEKQAHTFMLDAVEDCVKKITKN